ncbi:hypothetical protein [Desulfovibrio desulfuricans]|uniref:nSTAND3 domain-containing NTPase n=1 Tax=Desulfovibrio desulfuricans TaxID=876 RepID=UPI0003B5B7E2|nr:hypothetical protein [Desulfovibrio desulfuricans]
MNQYDFSNLNPNEFQTLANDLLSRLFNTHIEMFKLGKDMGIDGRFFCYEEDLPIIIQSKHYATSGFSKLLSDLIKVELPKIFKIPIKKYILVTSVPLSPYEKEKIQNGFSPFIKKSTDIFGKDDINSLLRRFPDVEKNYNKLWIPSSTALIHFLNTKNTNISQHFISEAKRKSADYVKTNTHFQAKEKITENNVLVITGDPGVGKTTLAEQLCLEIINDGYSPYVITSDIEEGFSSLANDEKQVFYFDDFLGKNYIETLRTNEDSKIMQFINIISKANNKKFILTSRTAILDQGYLVGPSFSNGKIKKREYLINISEYSNIDKARIFYSFLWKSDLSIDFLKYIIEDENYLKIILHRNYNPRLLEFITSSDHVDLENSNLYLDFINKSLNNPEEIWKHPYSVQLDNSARVIVDLIVFSNGNIKEQPLREAYYNFQKKNLILNNSNISKEFDFIISILIRSFVKKTIIIKLNKEEITFSLFNPSISDFIISQYSKNYSHIADIISLYENDDGIDFLEKATFHHQDISENVAKLICSKVNKNDLCSDIKYIRLGNLLDSETFISIYGHFSINDACKFIATLKNITCEILEFCSKMLSLCYPSCSKMDVYNLFIAILDCEIEYNELETLSSLLLEYPLDFHSNDINEKFYGHLLDLWKYEKIEEFATENIENFTEDESSVYDEEIDESYSIDKDALASLIINETSELVTPISNQDALDIINYTDLNNIASSFYRNESTSSSSSGHYSPGDQDIRGLFEGFLTAKFG